MFSPKARVWIGSTMLVLGSLWGLFVAPAEVFMGDVYRIFYIHVPTAWNSLLILTAAFVCALYSLITADPRWDDRLEAMLEGGVVLAGLLCLQGALWARPTWGVWWDWDPRLTTTAILVFAFGGILGLRASLRDPRRRAMITAVATIVAAADVPLVYFSVRFWKSLHQIQSSPATVSPEFVWPLRFNAVAVLVLFSGLISLRAAIAARRRSAFGAPPELAAVAASTPLGAAS